MAQYSKTESSNKQEDKKVISGNASLGDVPQEKAKGPLGKLKELFIADDLTHVKDYVVQNVVVPMLINTVSSSLKSTIDLVLKHPTTSTTNSTSSGTIKKINYSGRFDEYDLPMNTPKVTQEFGNVKDLSQEDAVTLKNNMRVIINQKGVVRVSELYDMAGIHTDNYQANKFGWTSVERAEIVQYREGDKIRYELKMPRPMPIE